MKRWKKIVESTSELLKLSTLAFLCCMFVFVANSYYQIKDYAETLSEELNIFVFFDKNSKNDDEKKILESINSEASIFVKEYVNSVEAYKKTVEENPLLSSISLPDASKSLQGYAIVKPKSIPDDNFLLEIRKVLDGIDGVDEVVFDESDFLRYAKIQKQLLLYKKAFFIVISVFFTFLILKFILAYIAGLDMLKKAKKFFLYLLASFIGFLLFWILCKHMYYSLLVSEIAVSLIIPFTSFIGVMFDNVETE
jgi:cell division protein FtsX